MTLAAALAAERRGDVEGAAAAYEQAIAAGDVSLGTLLNLAVLYWEATDTGGAAAHRLTAAFMATAETRSAELLAEAVRRYPSSVEARFWARYVAWLQGGAPFSIDECRRLLAEDRRALVPAMHLYALTDGREAAAEAEESDIRDSAKSRDPVPDETPTRFAEPLPPS